MSKNQNNHHQNAVRGFVFFARAVVFMAALSALACNMAAPPQPLERASEGALAAGSGPGAVKNETAIKDTLDVPITRLDGSIFRLDDFKGKVVMVDFWATYCPPCVRQAPQLAELSKRYRDQGLEVIGLTSDEKSDQSKVEEFIKRVGINYTIGYANNWVSGAFLRGTEDESGAPPIPQLFILSREGRVVEHLIGDSPQHGLPYLEKVVTRELALNTASR